MKLRLNLINLKIYSLLFEPTPKSRKCGDLENLQNFPNLYSIENQRIKFSKILKIWKIMPKTDFSEQTLILDFNFHPKGKHYDYSKDKEFKIEFSITSKEIYKILQKIKKTITYLLETR